MNTFNILNTNVIYTPFGSIMPNANNLDAGGYTYGMNGMMRDNEVKGNGNSYTSYWRQYDPRLGRWMSDEPKPVAWESGYAAFRNNPIYFADPTGDWPKWLGGKGGDGGGTQKAKTGKGTSLSDTEITNTTGNGDIRGGTLSEFTLVAGNSGNGSWSSEVMGKNPTFSFSGTFGQWKNTYGFSGDRMDVLNYWSTTYGNDFNRYVINEVNKEIARVAVEKMAWFIQAVEAESYVIGPVTGINAYQSLGNPKSFSYSSRSTNYYPANGGFANGQFTNEILQPGTMLDRYGSDFGRYLSLQGTPFNMRALPNSAAKSQLSIFRVTKPFSVQSGKAAPAFGKYGLGTQFKSSDNVKSLLEGGFLERVN